jgi:hypothetical protein
LSNSPRSAYSAASGRNLHRSSCEVMRIPGRERNMKHALDERHRNKDGEISHKHGNTTLGTLRKIYGKFFAAGHPDTATLSEILLKLNETSLSQLRRDYETGHLAKKISKAT